TVGRRWPSRGRATRPSGQQLNEQADAVPEVSPHPRRKPIHPGPPLVVLLDPFLEPVDPLVQRGVGAGLLQGNVADGAGHVVEAAAERVERGRDAALLLDDLEDRVGRGHHTSSTTSLMRDRASPTASSITARSSSKSTPCPAARSLIVSVSAVIFATASRDESAALFA